MSQPSVLFKKNDPTFFVNVKIYFYFVDGRKVLPEAEILIPSFEVKIYKKNLAQAMLGSALAWLRLS